MPKLPQHVYVCVPTTPQDPSGDNAALESRVNVDERRAITGNTLRDHILFVEYSAVGGGGCVVEQMCCVCVGGALV